VLEIEDWIRIGWFRKSTDSIEAENGAACIMAAPWLQELGCAVAGNPEGHLGAWIMADCFLERQRLTGNRAEGRMVFPSFQVVVKDCSVGEILAG
jgi:hypothetical protein